VVDFLADLHRRLGPLTVVWDRGPIHDKAKVVQAWLADHPGVKTEKRPAYAPTLNPDEGVWGWAKYGRLSNLAASDTEEIWDNVVEELVTAKHSPKLLNGFIQATELPEISLSG
jgi:transposase